MQGMVRSGPSQLPTLQCCWEVCGEGGEVWERAPRCRWHRVAITELSPGPSPSAMRAELRPPQLAKLRTQHWMADSWNGKRAEVHTDNPGATGAEGWALL